MTAEEKEARQETPPAPAAQESPPAEAAPPAAPEETQEARESPPAEAAPPAAREEARPAQAAQGRPAAEATPPPAREDPAERRRRRFGRRKVCAFCVEKAQSIDYKDPVKLRRYLSDRGRIEARRKTGTCAKHQRWLGVALKRARHLALLPYTPEHIRLTGVFAPRR